MYHRISHRLTDPVNRKSVLTRVRSPGSPETSADTIEVARYSKGGEAATNAVRVMGQGFHFTNPITHHGGVLGPD